MKNEDRYFKVKNDNQILSIFRGNTYPLASIDNNFIYLMVNDTSICFIPSDVEEIFQPEAASKRVFESGASRNSDAGKLDFDGFLSPLVLRKYAEYLEQHRMMEDGTIRDSDNWKAGIPIKQYMKSLWRHFFDTWDRHHGTETKETQVDNLCGVIFNSMGMLHELLKEEQQQHD